MRRDSTVAPVQVRLQHVKRAFPAKLTDLRAAPYNPRSIEPAAATGLKRSIEEFGDLSGIVWNKKTGNLVAGHQRVEQLRLAGAKMRSGKAGATVMLGDREFPVRIVDWPARREKAANLAANNPAISGVFVDALLPDLLADVKIELGDVDFAAMRFEDLFPAEAPAPGAEIEEDAIPEVKKGPAVTKKGDVWTLGLHRLMCGDCRVDADVAKVLTAPVNVAITSPPYASQRKYDETSGFTPIPPEKYCAWFADVQRNIGTHLAPDGSFFLNIKEHCDDGQRDLYVKDLTIAHVRQWGWRFVDEFCWTRQGVPGGWNNRFKNGWEPVFHFTRESGIKFHPKAVSHASDDVITYSRDNPKAASGSGLLSNPGTGGNGMALPNNVLAIATGSGVTSEEHSAAFPVNLPAFFIRAFTDVGDLIFDPFMGSGTTLIAAERTDRASAGIEISPAYCDVIIERWQTLTGKKATRG